MTTNLENTAAFKGNQIRCFGVPVIIACYKNDTVNSKLLVEIYVFSTSHPVWCTCKNYERDYSISEGSIRDEFVTQKNGFLKNEVETFIKDELDKKEISRDLFTGVETMEFTEWYDFVEKIWIAGACNKQISAIKNTTQFSLIRNQFEKICAISTN